MCSVHRMMNNFFQRQENHGIRTVKSLWTQQAQLCSKVCRTRFSGLRNDFPFHFHLYWMVNTKSLFFVIGMAIHLCAGLLKADNTMEHTHYLRKNRMWYSTDCSISMILDSERGKFLAFSLFSMVCSKLLLGNRISLVGIMDFALYLILCQA